MEGIKYLNVIEISPVVIEIRRVENGKLAVAVNSTFVHHTAFLASDIRPCVLITSTSDLQLQPSTAIANQLPGQLVSRTRRPNCFLNSS